jgi:hypothetical protein
VPPFLALDANHSAVGNLLVRPTVEGDLGGKTGRRAVSDEPNAGDGFTAGPMPNGIEAFLSKGVVTDFGSIELDHGERLQGCLPSRSLDHSKTRPLFDFGDHLAGDVAVFGVLGQDGHT